MRGGRKLIHTLACTHIRDKYYNPCCARGLRIAVHLTVYCTVLLILSINIFVGCGFCSIKKHILKVVFGVCIEKFFVSF